MDGLLFGEFCISKELTKFIILGNLKCLAFLPTCTLYMYFEAVNLTLKTSHFPKRHTGVNILCEMESVMEEFGIQNKRIHVVTDAGMHNSVFTDGIKNTPDVSNIVKAVR